MKKTIPALLSLIMACAMIAPVSAATDADILISEAPMVISEQAEEAAGRYTIQINGSDFSVDACIMVPLRAVAEPLGFTVTWNDGTILVDNGVMHTTVTVGEDRYIVATSVEGVEGMSAPFSLGAAPYVTDGTAYVPLELFEALLGNRPGTITLDDNKIQVNTGAGENVQIPNPFETCGSLAEAGALAGFDMEAPNSVQGLELAEARVIPGSMIELRYQSGEHEVCIRKAVGTGDISGDYSAYPDSRTIQADGLQATLKGADGKAYLATWTDGSFAFSVSASLGMDWTEMTALIQAVE